MADDQDFSTSEQSDGVVVNAKVGYRVDFRAPSVIRYTDDVLRTIGGNSAIVTLNVTSDALGAHLQIDSVPAQLRSHLGPQAEVTTYTAIVVDRVVLAASWRGMSIDF
jgi:hypothetical protein